MAIRDDAARNHAALFPDHTFTLKVTDEPSLDPRTRLMVQLAAIIASHAVAEYRVMLGGALNLGVTPIEVKEIVYQAVPYVGMAKVFDILHVTNDVFAQRGIPLPLPSQSTTTPETRMDKGLAVQRELLGGKLDQMYANAPKDQLHVQRSLSANCFGDYITRGGVDLRTRELLTLSMLAALGGCESQLAGHVALNLVAGNDRARMIATVTQLIPFIGYPRSLNAFRVIDEGTQGARP
jgi:4-carboxymuconolactone decarboxylase